MKSRVLTSYDHIPVNLQFSYEKLYIMGLSPTLGIHCCKGVVFWTTKSNVHAQDASLKTTEKTSNEAFLNNLFSKSDLPKDVHTVYSLNKKIRHLVLYNTQIQ